MLSAALVVLGIGVAAVLLSDAGAVVTDVLLGAGPLVVGGVVTGVLARRG